MNIKFFIIGIDGKLRNFNILAQLNECKTDYNLIQGIDGSLYDEVDLINSQLIDKKSLLKKYRIQPSVNELCCAIAHRDVLNKIKHSGHYESLDWIVVIEDDAILQNNLFHIINDISHLDKRELIAPSIISFFANSYVCSDNNQEFYVSKYLKYKMLDCLVQPASAVCYMINKAALIKLCALENIISDRSDWPRTYSKIVNFYLILPTFVETNTYPSLIDTPNIYRIKNRKFEQTVNLLFKNLMLKFLNIRFYNNFNSYFHNECKIVYYFILSKFNVIKIIQKGYW